MVHKTFLILNFILNQTHDLLLVSSIALECKEDFGASLMDFSPEGGASGCKVPWAVGGGSETPPSSIPSPPLLVDF